MKLPLTYQPTTPAPEPKKEDVSPDLLKGLIEIMSIPIDDGQCCVTEDKKD